MGEERVWAKRGSRLQLPRVPRPLRAATGVGVVSLSLVGLLAVPAGSPPPSAAVAPTSMASTEPVAAPSTEPTVTPPPVEQPPVRPVCHPKGLAGPALPPASGDGSVSTVTYQHGTGIWLYDIAKNSSREIVRGTSKCGYYYPRFIDRRTIAFSDDASDFHTVDVLTGAIHTLSSHLRTRWPNGWLAGFDINSDHLMAVMGSGQQFQGRPQYELAVSSTTTGRLVYRRELGVVCGCDGGDPLSLEWSRDGSLLVVGITTSTDSLVYVFDRFGKQVVVPQKGFDATWLGNTHTLIFEKHGATRNVWTSFDVARRTSSDFLPARDLAYPVSSPDGSKVAFTDDSSGRVVVFDFNLRTSNTMPGPHAYPIWLDNDRVAAALTQSCICEGPQFQPTGKVDSISVSTGRVRRLVLDMTWTVDLI